MCRFGTGGVYFTTFVVLSNPDMVVEWQTALLTVNKWRKHQSSEFYFENISIRKSSNLETFQFKNLSVKKILRFQHEMVLGFYKMPVGDWWC